MSALASIMGEVVTVELGGQIIDLVPTLGAAIAVLEADEAGFAGVVDRLRDGDFTLTLTILGCAAAELPELVSRSAAWAAFSEGDLVERVSRFVLILANGGEPLKPAEVGAGGGGRSLTHVDYLIRLHRIATGQLGWTHAQAMATPLPAIINAHLGRQELLQAIFGGPAPTPSRNDIPLDQKWRLAMAGARKVEP